MESLRSAGEEIDEESACVPTIPCPILTRWWTVGVAATFLLKHWNIIAVVAQGVINRLSTIKKCNQIASGVQSLMCEPVIKSDIHLISAFHTYFLFSHFAWLQKGDPEVGAAPGFLARHMASRYFLMHSDLTSGRENWRNLPIFQDFISSQEQLTDSVESERQIKKANEFFRIALELLEKHFDLWVNKHLFLALFGEVDTAQVVAQFLLGREATGFARNGMSESKIHERQISTSSFRDFLEARFTI